MPRTTSDFNKDSSQSIFLFEFRLLGERDVFRLVPNSDLSGFGEDALLFWAVCFGVVVRGLGDDVFDLGLADIFLLVY